MESAATIERLILHEVHTGIEANRIIIAGFSQGASLCLMTALTTWHEIGGVGCLSGWIPHLVREVSLSSTAERPDTQILITQSILGNEPCMPVFWAHGTSDTEIPLRLANDSIDFLRRCLRMSDSQIRIHEYPDIGHEVTDEMIRDLCSWIRDVFSR